MKVSPSFGSAGAAIVATVAAVMDEGYAAVQEDMMEKSGRDIDRQLCSPVPPASASIRLPAD